MLYVPQFIVSNQRRGKLRGRLDAWVLRVEIANFAKLSDEAQQFGKKGAQELAERLNSLYKEALGKLDQRGAIVIRLNGDSFWALLPRSGSGHPWDRLETLNELQAGFKQLGRESGDPVPQARMLLGCGLINWRIFPNELQHEYIFFGKELDEMEKTPVRAKALSFTAGAAKHLSIRIQPENSETRAMGTKPPREPDRDQSGTEDDESRLLFEHPRWRKLVPAPSFRKVVCTHARLILKDPSSLERLIQDMELLAITFGAHVTDLRKRGNEYSVSVYFGAAGPHAGAAYTACRSILDTLKKYPLLRHGIATGTVFCGMMGDEGFRHLAICGPLASRAAELCDLAAPGEVVTDHQLYSQNNEKFSFQPIPREKLPRGLKSSGAFRLLGMPVPGSTTGRRGYVGRKKELARLKSLIGKSFKARQNLAVVVCGEPGIGKTRLTLEILDSLSADGFQAASLWCDLSLGPLEPVKQLFRQLFSPNPGQTETAEDFSRFWRQWAGRNENLSRGESFIGAMFDLHWPGSLYELTPAELRLERIMEAGALALNELGRQKPLLIHIDDLQWMDPQSLEFFQRLGGTDKGGICILATSRYLEGDSVPALGPRNFSLLRLDLGPLNRHEVIDLQKALLGLESLPPATLEMLKSCTNGNPFAIEQSVAFSLEKGFLNARGEYHLPEDWNRFGVEDALLHRIGNLSAKTRQSIYSASVLGMRFNINVLSQMLNTDARRELANGSRNRIWNDLGEFFYIFSHVLIQEAVYARILGEELRKLHLSAAQALEKVYELELSEHAEEIARHYAKAGQPDKAAAYYDRAADRLWDRAFFDRAEANSLRAIELSAEAGGINSRQYGECVFHLALLYHFLSRFPEAEPLYDEAMRIARLVHGARSKELSPYLNNLGRFYKDTGRFAQSEKLLKRSLAIERKQHPTSSNVADRINNLAHLYSIQKQLDKAETWYLEALRIMEENYDPQHFFTGALYANLGGIYFERGQLPRAQKFLTRAVEIKSRAWVRTIPSQHNPPTIWEKCITPGNASGKLRQSF